MSMRKGESFHQPTSPNPHNNLWVTRPVPRDLRRNAGSQQRSGTAPAGIGAMSSSAMSGFNRQFFGGPPGTAQGSYGTGPGAYDSTLSSQTAGGSAKKGSPPRITRKQLA